MNATDLRELEGKIVLVTSGQDHRNPPTGRRGTLHVDTSEGAPRVSAEIDFPEMFTSRAHVRRIVLTEAQLADMLATEHYGAFTLTLDERLDPVLHPRTE